MLLIQSATRVGESKKGVRLKRLVVAGVVALRLLVPAVVAAQALAPVSPISSSIAVPSPTDTPSLRWPLIVYAAVGSADFASTIVAERKGAVERNPFIPDFGWNERHPTTMLLEGAAIEIAVVALAREFLAPKHHTIATVLLYGIAGGRSALIVHNLLWTRPAWEGIPMNAPYAGGRGKSRRIRHR